MQKLSRTAALVGLGLFLVVVIAFIGANLYVQAQATQARIQQELRQRLGVDVRIGQISVTPWAGIVLSGITVPQAGSPDNAPPFLQAQRIRLRLRLLSLLQKRLVVRRVAIVDPAVVWQQDKEGKWRLPSPAELRSSTGHEETVEQQPAPAVVETPASVAPATTGSASPEPVASAKEQPLEPQIRHVVISGGNFTFNDRVGGTVARFEDVSFGSTLEPGGGLRGHAHVARVGVRDRVDLSDLHTEVSYDDVTLKLTRFGAQIASGKLDGELQIQPEAAGAPFEVKARFNGVDADQLIMAAGGKTGTVRGKLEGFLNAAGRSSDINQLSGTGEIILRDGQFQQYSLLVALGQVLQIDELTQLHLENAFAKYHLAGNIIAVDQLLLKSANIELSGTGTVGFDGKMHLDAQLAMDEKLHARLFRAVRDNFHPTAQPGYSAVDFEVNGTLDHPKSNLVEKLVGRDLKDIGSMINSFLGGKSERKKKKAAQGEGEVPPAGSPAQPTATP